MTELTHIQKIVQRLGELFGLSFTTSQHPNMIRNLALAAVERNRSSDLSSLQQWLDSDQLTDDEIDSLMRRLAIGETYFFREKTALELLSEVVIPSVSERSPGAGKSLTIWSAGCSSGEEPYTLAIALKEMLPDFEQWHITIVGTDINPDALEKARKAIYTPWSFRDTSGDIQDKYFRPIGRNRELRPEIREMVQFRRLNLATQNWTSIDTGRKPDVIFCRNVLMYFLPDTARMIAQQFHHHLNDEGWLVTSQVELSDDYFSMFKRVLYSNSIFYQKTNKTGAQSNVGRLYQVHGLTETEVGYVKPFEKKEVTNGKSVIFRKVALKPTALPKPVAREIVDPSTLFNSGRYKECSAICYEKLQINPADEPTMELLVKALANSGELESAAQWSEKLIEAQGGTSTNLYLYATVLIELNKPDEAEKTLIKALYLNPIHLAARLNLGQLLMRSGRKTQAAKHLRNLIADLDAIEAETIVAETGGITAGGLRQLADMLLNQ